jgi:hypothetical protein
LIDDFLSPGTGLNETAKKLKKSWIKKVYGLVVLWM